MIFSKTLCLFQLVSLEGFKYKKDSVVVVNGSEYEKCHSVHPIFFSNNGDTVLQLDHSGLFYFISGVAGHCQKGQKMIVKVLDLENLSPPGSDKNQTSSDKSGAVSTRDRIVALPVIVFLISVFRLFFA